MIASCYGSKRQFVPRANRRGGGDAIGARWCGCRMAAESCSRFRRLRSGLTPVDGAVSSGATAAADRRYMSAATAGGRKVCGTVSGGKNIEGRIWGTVGLGVVL